MSYEKTRPHENTWTSLKKRQHQRLNITEVDIKNEMAMTSKFSLTTQEKDFFGKFEPHIRIR